MAFKFLEKISDNMELEDTNYLEIDETERDRRKNIMIRIENLNEYSDTERIQKLVREGDIVWVKIRALKEKDMTELKRAIDKLRKTCIAINGDIAGVDEEFVILAPEGVAIHRKEG